MPRCCLYHSHVNTWSGRASEEGPGAGRNAVAAGGMIGHSGRVPCFQRPTIDLRESFLAGMAEFAGEGRTGDGSMIGTDLARWAPALGRPGGFADYVARPARRRPRGHAAGT